MESPSNFRVPYPSLSRTTKAKAMKIHETNIDGATGGKNYHSHLDRNTMPIVLIKLRSKTL
uniref:Uncharacterized protein n=1 Tax=Romanomermis culicivorax TaxID=13658 RepID=A0A915JI59_ROMCU